ncbi:MAG: hypothetical protein JXX14_20815 [Deltaproteobacteria bacterium]|nr:hypothetical protein [Deltaproteobacteria bacterium]
MHFNSAPVTGIERLLKSSSSFPGIAIFIFINCLYPASFLLLFELVHWPSVYMQLSALVPGVLALVWSLRDRADKWLAANAVLLLIVTGLSLYGDWVATAAVSIVP